MNSMIYSEPLRELFTSTTDLYTYAHFCLYRCIGFVLFNLIIWVSCITNTTCIHFQIFSWQDVSQPSYTHFYVAKGLWRGWVKVLTLDWTCLLALVISFLLVQICDKLYTSVPNFRFSREVQTHHKVTPECKANVMFEAQFHST